MPRLTTEKPPNSDSPETARGVRLSDGGLEIGGAFVPLTSGSIHYWHLDPRDWRACLSSTRDMGVRLVDVYIPWGVHEVAPGRLELGERDARRDVGAFLRLAHELGLYAIVRPGPHINAELTYFGLPERIIWDPGCQARSSRGQPVMLPMLPFAFPVPSYASQAFHREAARYFQLLGPVLRPLLYPDGPIVLIQVDNEGALYFRDGAYDQDYHPDAIRLYRDFLRNKYGSFERVGMLYPARAFARNEGGTAGTAGFESILPPTRFDAETTADLARHMDWSEFHEHLLASAFERFAAALEAAGIAGLPTSHNLPPGQEGGPLNAARVTRSVDLVGLDYYQVASPESRRIVARRTGELATRCQGQGVPPFACEMGAGFPPFFPPIQEADSAFIVLVALAYGLRGFNIYMAVDRDRWIGSPIDCHGSPRPFSVFWRRLIHALDRTDFFHLRRQVPVRILTPRSERRLARVMHAFGPVSGVFFSVAGKGARESASENDLGLGYPVGVEADSFARTCEEALDAWGVPFAHVGGEDRDVSLDNARWIICATGGGMNPALFERLAREARHGTLITIGPRAVTFDGAYRNLRHSVDLARLRPAGPESPPVLAANDSETVNGLVAWAVDRYEIQRYACEPPGVFATVHEDREGRGRVLFVINTERTEVTATVNAAPGAARAIDLIGEGSFVAPAGDFTVRMLPQSVRMLALE